MEVTETALPGVLILKPKVFGDDRGFFMETYNKDRYAELGISCEFIQDNHSASVRNTVRGMHYQLGRPQAKLCRVVAGAVLDVVVDVRKGSPTLGKWVSVLLSDENKLKIFVPRGFAHGFAVLSDRAEFLYKCDDAYSPGSERGIAWDDPDLGIDWQITGEPLLSAKDLTLPRLKDIPDSDLL